LRRISPFELFHSRRPLPGETVPVNRSPWKGFRGYRTLLRVAPVITSTKPIHPPAPPARMARRRHARGVRTALPHVLSESLFARSLLRQQRRVDRTNDSAVALVIRLEGGGEESAALWDRIVAALAAATRETDVLGWIERGAVLGAILSDADLIDGARRVELESRLRASLAARMELEAAQRVSILFYVHTPANRRYQEGAAADQLWQPRRPAGIYASVKRALDITGSLILLVALSPLLVLIAAAVKLTSPGPVLFRQVRVGRMVKPFTMLKFRTMSAAADHAIHREYVTQFIQGGDARQQAAAGVFKITNDPRITSIGRLLRKTSLDELPQLWNVLRGDMSLVGPRPPIPYEVEHYQSWHCRRVLDAKPGITGLWQVTGRSRTTFDEMVRLDIRYARTCSLSTDLKILLATPAAVVAGKGAC
jgi:lipopolysaccharide/colanic/teichoic acid biosynthesis glycosyltransferase